MDTCPNCGADLPPKANFCPQCGSDKSTGWSEETNSDGLDLPDEDFDYGEFVRHEFQGKQRRLHWIWLLAVVVLVLLLIFSFW
jgi:uncharacterized membrane protein YvbJ